MCWRGVAWRPAHSQEDCVGSERGDTRSLVLDSSQEPAMAAEEASTAAATAAAAAVSEQPVVVTVDNVSKVPLDALPTKVKAWDPIGLAIFTEVAEILISRWGLLKFVMDEQSAGEKTQEKYDFMMEDYFTNIKEFWEKKMPLAWETTEDYFISVLSSDFNVDFEDGTEGGLVRMSKHVSGMYEPCSQGDLSAAVRLLKAAEDAEVAAEEAEAAAVPTAAAATDAPAEGASTAAAAADAPAEEGDDGGWTTVTKGTGH